MYLAVALATIISAVAWSAWDSDRTQTNNTSEQETTSSDTPAPVSPEVLLERAQALKGAEPRRALTAAKNASTALPESGEAHLLTAEALLSLERYEEAEESIEKAELFLPQDEVAPRVLIVESLLKQGRYRLAAESAARSLEQFGSNQHLQRLRARALLEDHHLEEAAQTLKTLTRMNREDVEAWLLLGETSEKQQDWPQAASAFEQAINLRPAQPEGYLGLGRTLLASNRGSEATEKLAQGLSIMPDELTLRYAVGRGFLREGQLSKAVPHLEMYREMQSSDWRSALYLGLAYLRSQALDKAAAQFEAAVEMRPDEAVTHYNLGVARTKLKQFRPAIAAFAKAIDLRYGLWEAHCEKAKAHFQLQQLEPARGGFEEAARINSECALAAAMLVNGVESGRAHLHIGLPCSGQLGLEAPD
jgi:tetratricopeptide (TPR) repeat protein